jgi:NAD+ kinase
MKILVVCRIDNPDALSYAQKLQSTLAQAGCDVGFDGGTSAVVGEIGLPFSGADIVIVVGGDGTILRTVQQMQPQVPLIGINWGEVGFLADLEPSEALKFITTLPKGFSIEERMRISFSREGVHLGDALNEALIVTARPAKMLRFSIVVDGVVAEQFRSDGLLISTPTGSTAYAMSAGGPIVDPRIHGFLLVPLAPYMLSSRPHIISSSRRLEIRLESSKPANLVIDGQEAIDLGSSGAIEVSQAEYPALFVDAHRNFFEKVDKKLRKL